MDNFDAEIIEWILKGGAGSGPQPGHPFEGNQYTHMDAKSGILALAARAENPDHTAIAQGHRDMAEWHKGQAKSIYEQKIRPLGKIMNGTAQTHTKDGDAFSRAYKAYGTASNAMDAHYLAAQNHEEAAQLHEQDARGEMPNGTRSYLNTDPREDAMYSTYTETNPSKASDLASDSTYFANVQGTGVIGKSVSVEKGGPQNPEPQGHRFYGDRWVGTRAPANLERIGDAHTNAAEHHQAREKEARAAGDNEKADFHHSQASMHLRSASANYRSAGNAEKAARAGDALASHTVGDFPGHPFRGNQYTKSVDDVVEKGDLLGHIFHGNQHSKGEGGGKPKPIRQIDTGRFQVEPDRYTLVGPTAREHAKKPTIEGHHDLALLHREAASGLMQMKEGSSEARQSALHAAAKAHADAAEWHEIAASNYTNGVINGNANYLKEGSDFASSMSDRADSRTANALGIRKELTMTSEIQKGESKGHEFHGNQWTSGESGKIFDNYRPADINQTISQIGKMNILGISGGRVNPLRNTEGETVGIHLPVGKGYGVNVLLHPNDTYTVQRVTTRSGVVKIKGQEDGVYAEDVGDTAYRAGMYMNVPFGDHQGTLG